jgi:Tol biopolymer transport system component
LTIRLVCATGLVAAAVGVCSSALGAGIGPLTGRIVFTATDAPLADDVMLVRTNGVRIDLSKSAAYDGAPVVSPDGKHVAFFSLRGGHGAEYVVSTDGSGLRQVTPPMDVQPSVAWSPSESQLAVLVGAGQGTGSIHLAASGGGVWKLVAGVDQPQALVGWSPDGSRIAYTNELGVEVVTPTGHKLLDLAGEGASWSPTGRLVVSRNSTTMDLYDPSGKRVARLPAVSASWSPGDLLATSTAGGLVEVRSHGVGRPSVSIHLGNGGSLRWVSSTVVQIGQTTLAYDVARKRVIKLPAGFSPTASVLPSLGVAFGEPSFGMLVKSTVGKTNRLVTAYPACQGRNADAFSSLQALPDGSGAVYAGDCAPPSDVFSVRPNGTGLTRLTHTKEDESSVTASPDGSKLAFTRTSEAECVGCDQRLVVTNADASGPVAVPLAAPMGGIRQDQDPSFSPDGSSVVFSRWNSSVGDAARLYRVPAAGGDASALGVVGTAPAWGKPRIGYLGPKGVATVMPDGSGNRRVQGVALADEGPLAWSEGGRLAVLRTALPLAIVIPSSARRIALPGFSEPAEHGAGLAWSPDGTKLAFVAADRDGIGDIWTVNADGTGLKRLTHNLGAGGTLSWR